MVGTRVGFAGGSTPSPVYHHPGDHTESVEVTFDPAVISYAELLEVFWESHPNWLEGGPSRVATGVFTADERQNQMALDSLQRRPDAKSRIARSEGFFPAERKHQKFELQRVVPDLVKGLEAVVSEGEPFLSTALASKMNAYLTGFGSREAVEAAALEAGLDPGPILDRLDEKKIR